MSDDYVNPNINDETTTITRRGKKSDKPRTGYFYEEQEEAFLRYVSSKKQGERNKIFREILLPAFTKMIESIIRRYNYFIPDEEFDETFYDTLSHMMSKVNNYDVTKGTKVYSYCGTICRNHLRAKRKNFQKRQEREILYDSVSPTGIGDTREDDDLEAATIKFNNEVIQSTTEKLQELLEIEDTNENALTENERKVAIALLELLMNWEDIFSRMESRKFSKMSVLYFIKEQTHLSTSEVREAMRRFKTVYFDVKENLIIE